MISPPADTLRLAETFARTDEHTRASGRAWYQLAHGECCALAEDHACDTATAAGVVAALSPRMAWHMNLQAAARLLRAAANGADAPPRVGLGRNTARAWQIAHGAPPLDILGGEKVRAFFRNLNGDLAPVTVDIWATRAARGADAPPPRSAREYAQIAQAYTAAARAEDMPPAVFQAVIWIAARGIAEDMRHYTIARKQLAFEL